MSNPSNPLSQSPQLGSTLLPEGAGSDSAPPPAPPPIPLPRKDYLSPLAPLPPPQTLRPNASIPAFLRLLAYAVFIIGGVAGASAWVYRHILYSRLVLALNARTQLHLTHLASYGQLLESIRALATGPGYRLISPKREEAAQPSGEVEPAREEKEAASEGENTGPEQGKDSVVAEGGERAAVAEGEEEVPPAPPAIFAPLSASLQALSATLNTTPPPVDLFSIPAIPSSKPAATKGLESSLTTLSDYLAAETLVSLSAAYRTQLPSSSSAGHEQKILHDAVSVLKAEIRQVKGALLNRRNFAALVPRADPPRVASAS